VIEVPDIGMPSAYARKQLGMENGNAQPAVLRCFRQQDCQRDGKRLLDLINAQLAVPSITVQVANDRSAYANGKASGPRERHFELWFGPGPIELRTQKGATAQ
jgi:hypothetical protein